MRKEDEPRGTGRRLRRVARSAAVRGALRHRLLRRTEAAGRGGCQRGAASDIRAPQEDRAFHPADLVVETQRVVEVEGAGTYAGNGVEGEIVHAAVRSSRWDTPRRAAS